MIRHTRRLIEFLADHNMSMEQFLLCWIHYQDSAEYGHPFPNNDNEIANIYLYTNEVNPWPDDAIQDLIRRGYLINKGDPDDYYPDMLEVTDKFVDEVMATRTDFERFREAYPKFIEHWEEGNDSKVPLQSCELDKVERIFYRTIRSQPEFERLMEAVEYGKENDMIRMNILKFLSGEYHHALLELREEGYTGQEARQKLINQ